MRFNQLVFWIGGQNDDRHGVKTIKEQDKARYSWMKHVKAEDNIEPDIVEPLLGKGAGAAWEFVGILTSVAILGLAAAGILAFISGATSYSLMAGSNPPHIIATYWIKQNCYEAAAAIRINTNDPAWCIK